LKVLEENHYYPFGLKHTEALLKKDIFYEKEDEEWLKKVDLVSEIKKGIVVPNSGYQYKYNGKEWQDELNLNLYDYGARNYDPALGRWMNLDPLANMYPSTSPYAFVNNNPLIFVDPDGRLILSAKFVRDYPEIANYIKNNLKNDVLNSPRIMEALSQVTGGNLNAKTVSYALTDGQGPKYQTSKAPGGSEGATGYYNSSSNTIQIGQEFLNKIEEVLKNGSLEQKEEAALALLMSTLHEFSHYGDWLDGSFAGGDVGWDLEKMLFRKVTDDPWNKESVDKHDSDDLRKFINNDKDNDVLPTLPTSAKSDKKSTVKPDLFDKKREYPGSAGPADKRKLPDPKKKQNEN